MTPLNGTDEATNNRGENFAKDKFLGTEDVFAIISGDVSKSGRLEVLECALMSGSALAKELNTPEEDEAWAHFNPET